MITCQNKSSWLSYGPMKRRFLGIKKRFSPYLYFFPALMLAYLFSYRPFAKTFLNSFSLVNFAGKIIGFVGLDNFKALIFDPNFQTSLINTFKFAFVFIPLDLLFCLICCEWAATLQKPSGSRLGHLTFNRPQQ